MEIDGQEGLLTVGAEEDLLFDMILGQNWKIPRTNWGSNSTSQYKFYCATCHCCADRQGFFTFPKYCLLILSTNWKNY